MPTASTSASATSSVPDLPGFPADYGTQAALREHVATLTGTHGGRFPGAQPVSFTKASLDMLLNEDFWVCEKSDGQRVLVFIVANGNTGQQEVFLIDRKNNYLLQPGLFFPHSEQKFYPKGTQEQKAAAWRRAQENSIPFKDGWPGRKDTLLDGELVWDTDKHTGKRTLRLLLFDALVVDGVNMSHRTLTKRYGRLHAMIYPPFAEYMRTNAAAAAQAPFDVKVKHMELAYGIQAVLQRMPHLEHGNDGLIFTGMHSGYTFGTDQKIIKWKPPSENSIDFILRLRFPPDERVPAGNVPDFRAKPLFLLEEYMGDENTGRGRESRYEPFDWLWVDDDEWEEMKRSGVQYDDRIVECVWVEGAGPPLDDHEGEAGAEVGMDIDGGPSRAARPRPPGWRIHRFRDDKRDGNHYSIVRKILGSIEDGVDEKEVSPRILHESEHASIR